MLALFIIIPGLYSNQTPANQQTLLQPRPQLIQESPNIRQPVQKPTFYPADINSFRIPDIATYQRNQQPSKFTMDTTKKGRRKYGVLCRL